MNISVQSLREKLDQGEDISLIDVRETYEHEEFNIGGELIPIGSMTAAISELELPKDKSIVVYCRSGNRSMMGQHLLKAAGFSNVLNLEGGMLAWQDMVANKS